MLDDERGYISCRGLIVGAGIVDWDVVDDYVGLEG